MDQQLMLILPGYRGTNVVHSVGTFDECFERAVALGCESFQLRDLRTGQDVNAEPVKEED